MNIYECERKAQEIGFDKAKFIAFFPSGPTNCKWLDAYMGLIQIDADGLRDGFVMTRQIAEEFPGLFVTDPFLDSAE